MSGQYIQPPPAVIMPLRAHHVGLAPDVATDVVLRLLWPYSYSYSYAVARAGSNVITAKALTHLYYPYGLSQELRSLQPYQQAVRCKRGLTAVACCRMVVRVD
eukprot:COSAG01_NODE_4340_length_5121_cov_16.529669_3_plen_103_part_00